MEFPVYLPVGPYRVHPHLFFEAMAYAAGFQWYRYLRARRGDPIVSSHRWAVVAAAIAGAAVGSKVLRWLNDPTAVWDHRHEPERWLAGKTIVGGLLGGLVAVELAKRAMHVGQRTGDLFALPLCLGILVGRIGCFLTGLSDETHGVSTTLPWGVDYGDGVTRHPTQLYEILFLSIVMVALALRWRTAHREGDLFKTFLAGYLAFRFLLAFLQPSVTLLGLTAIQWASLAGLAYCARDLPRLLSRREVAAHA